MQALSRDQIDASFQTDEWWHQENDLGFHMSQSAASGNAVVVVATLVCEVGKSVLFASQRDELRLHVMT